MTEILNLLEFYVFINENELRKKNFRWGKDPAGETISKVTT